MFPKVRIMSKNPFKDNQETRDRIQQSIDYDRTKEMAEGGDADAIVTCFKNEFLDVFDDLDAFDEAVFFVDERLVSDDYHGCGPWDIYEEAGQYARKAMNGGSSSQGRGTAKGSQDIKAKRIQ